MKFSKICKGLLFFLLLSTSMVFAQINTTIDSFISQEFADYDTSLYILGISSGLITEEQGVSDVLLVYDSKRSVPKRNGDKPINAGQFGHALLTLMDIPGGLAFSLFQSPWYASKELEFQGFLPEVKRANQWLTPFEVMFAVQRALNYRSARGIGPPEPSIGLTAADSRRLELLSEQLRATATENLGEASRGTSTLGGGTGGVFEVDEEVGIDDSM